MLLPPTRTVLFCGCVLFLLFILMSLPRSEFHPAAQTAPEFKFPWPAGLWEYRQGWHPDPGNVALDIGTRGDGADKRVLAAADGVITKVCRGTKSANVIIDHAGTTLEYWHFDVTKLAPGIDANQPVVRGQVLGTLLSGTWTRADDGGDDKGCGEALDQQSNSAHLHWVIRASSFTADGWTIQKPSSTWTNGSQTVNPRCENCQYEHLPSTNVPSARVEVTNTGGGSGAVTSYPAGISCGTDCEGGYALGSNLILIASAGGGSAFSGWSGACSGTATTCVVAINANKSVTANFQSNVSFELRASLSGDGTGKITGPGIDCGGDCRESFLSGTRVTLQASAAQGSAFMGWSGDCTGTSPCTVTMNQAKSVSANFKKPAAGKFILTAAKDGNGRGWVETFGQGIFCDLDCTEEYASGTIVKLRASPEVGSNFTGWSGACSGTSDLCEITMSDSKVATATFTSINDPISPAILVAPNGTVSSRTPDFIWQKHSFTASYKLEVAPASSPSTNIISEGPYSSDRLCSTANGLCSLTSTRVLFDNKYVWRIHATNLDDPFHTAPSVSEDMAFRLVGEPCSYTITPTSPTDFDVRGGTGTIRVTTQSHCRWITDSTWWMRVNQGSGQGSGTIDYKVFANCSPQVRSGNVYVIGLDSSQHLVPVTEAQNKTFSVGTFYPSTGFYNVNSGDWKAGDFNGDGRGDLVHLTDSDYIHPWISHGDGTFDVLQFKFRQGYMIRSGTWLTGDFDKDGRADLAHVTDNDYVNFWFSNGDGTFTEKRWLANPAGYNTRSGRWLAGDLNGDGRTDLMHMLNGTYMHAWLSRADRTWDVQTFVPGDGRYSVGSGYFLPGDFNGDGRTDMIHFVGTYIHTWLSTGDGRFTVLDRFAPWPDYGFGLGHFQVGDIDGDGDDDLVHITGLHYVHLWISRGDGRFDVKSFSPGEGYNTGDGIWLAGDFDADGKMDLLHHLGDFAHPWMSKGDGTFALSSVCANPLFGYNEKSGRWIQVDLNGDRKTDWVHLVADTYVHPWISGADESTYQGWTTDSLYAAPGATACPSCAVPPDIKVWANTASGLYHCRGQRLYGRTKRGLYMTQKQAIDIGFRAAYKRICRS